MKKIKQTQSTILLKKNTICSSFLKFLIFPKFFQQHFLNLNILLNLPLNFILFFISILFFSSFCSILAQTNEQIRQKCLSLEASQSCSNCISINPECAWCADNTLLNSSSQRCNAKWEFTSNKDKCPNQQIYSPNTEIKVAPPHNLPLGGRRSDGVTIIQLEPQQVEIKMKPGDEVEVPFRYLHKLPISGYEVRDFTIQTSEFRSLGIDIEFTIECNGEKIIGRVCPGIQPDQKISFNAKVILNDCSKPNLAAVSVGIYGYNTVSAIFITPICGCECEHFRQQERRSPRCSYSGNLVCGICQCDPGKGGERCECDLEKYGVSKAEELIGLCKEHKHAKICSDRGQCNCGQCQCLQADYISGRYCECDSSICPLSVSGQICSGRGTCQCGKYCSCDDDPEPCTENGVTCFNNGYCECGICSCNVGWTGNRCNIPESLPEESTSNFITSSTTSNENIVDNAEVHGEVLTDEDEDEMEFRNSQNDGEFLPTPKSTIESIQEGQQQQVV
ncbi:I-EGF_1 domain-containing protein [Meloidogyne graminicola]|uniref:I-EGF_1 domain-containing protein n=1 Tax=Meloidogyne graminicola TaxID=189291 RepID=A0A8S9ZRP1_9BILA|nr:I-EGF_1 domain-containing protein [Meloidogyne graminicola]